jgi:hypothetical protein
MPFSAGALRMLGADIPFHDLAMRHPGLTPEIGECYTRAVRVCLDRHHTPPIDVRYDHLRNGSLAEAVARWESTTNQERNAWANDIDTTEQGAYGFALAIVDLAEGMIAVRRAETGTGADYYIAAPVRPRMIWRIAFALRSRGLIEAMNKPSGNGCARRSSKRGMGIAACQLLLPSLDFESASWP